MVLSWDKKGFPRNISCPPIMQMGLFMDGKEVPICMDVFRGNMSDSDTLKENLDGFKKEYGIERIAVVADKGMNCSNNLDLLCSQGDGYVFSRILKGTKGKRYQEALSAPESWQESPDGSYKWKLITEEYQGHDIFFEIQDWQKTEKKKVIKRLRKVLLYWSKADAEMIEKRRKAEGGRKEYKEQCLWEHSWNRAIVCGTNFCYAYEKFVGAL